MEPASMERPRLKRANQPIVDVRAFRQFLARPPRVPERLLHQPPGVARVNSHTIGATSQPRPNRNEGQAKFQNIQSRLSAWAEGVTA